MSKISKSTSVREIVTNYPQAAAFSTSTGCGVAAARTVRLSPLSFSPRSSERDRSWKFIRAAYTWLLVAMGMLPFLILYSVLTRQYFAHSYTGAYRHAFTVGFVSLMIVGVAARVVPILAGLDSKQISSLWGPFILVNIGCAGRVILQVLTDFLPNMAYPLVGLTGFIEVAALAWWGTELWHTMNQAKARRPGLIPAST